MTNRPMFVPIAVLASLLLCFSVFARADELKSIAQLSEQGQQAAALDRVNGFLKTRPDDTQALFLKGVISAELGKSADAIKIFSDLTSQHPELPEPYNNLAVIYADQGQYDKARRALEMAIRTHPSYATAHENLGDVYAKMATDAYDKALQLDKNNPRTQTKLAMVKEIFSGGTVRPMPAVAKTEPPVVAKQASVAVPVAPVKPATQTVAAAPVQPPAGSSAKVAASGVVAQPQPVKVQQEKHEDEKPKAAEKKPESDPTKDIEETVKNWAKAWSAKNVDGYLAFYGAGFKVPGGESRSAWEKSRRERIGAPASIKVELTGIKIKMDGENRVAVSFHQSYRAGDVAKRTSKTLMLKKAGAKWYIEQELTDH
jgi:tetratricopeptide (TPR) repeat protein